LRFIPETVDGVEPRMLIAAASRVVRGEVAARARLLAADADDAFAIGAGGELLWRDAAVGLMVAGESLLAPRAEPLSSDFLEGENRERVRRRLHEFLRRAIERRLAPLFAAQALPLNGAGRGLVFQLVGGLGCLPVAEIRSQIAALDPSDRSALSRIGVRFGTESVYFEPLLRADAMRFRALLWAVRHGRPVPALPGARRLAKPFEADPALPASLYEAIGLRVVEGIVMRPDRLERVAAAARRLARGGPFSAGAELAATAGLPPAGLRRLLLALGYRAIIADGEEIFIPRPRRLRKAKNARYRRERPGDGHPFAKLGELKLA
jgi:ATP-dependent RNA helicase SUPV3L1/SUV3